MMMSGAIRPSASAVMSRISSGFLRSGSGSRTVRTRAHHQLTIPSSGDSSDVLEFVHEIEAKKSRFVAFGWHVDSEDQALSYIKAAADPSASHNCWAIRIAGSTVRYNDDGGPGGTGGKPILSALETLGVDRSAIMVTRYYGGGY